MERISIFLDGADIADVKKLSFKKYIKGFTSNPTLMSKSGITNYNDFIIKFLSACNNKPVSFEVVSDDFKSMENEARKISSYADNIYVKIPITNSRGESSLDLIKKLLLDGLKINITAVLSQRQIDNVLNILNQNDDVIVSYFAGRVADTGIDPVPVLVNLQSKILEKKLLKTKTLWASPREVLNIYQANSIGVDIITVTKSLIDKLELKHKDLDEYSLETVKMFLNDAIKSNLNL